MPGENTHSYLLRALELAERRRGFCAPNPAVGAVVVENGQVVGEGSHWAAGHPHAEVDALRALKSPPTADTELYVTLEPCCHHGRTPPCTDLLLQSGIRRIVFGFPDPNPRVAGRGQKILQDAGRECEVIQLSEISRFYESYAHWTQTRRPFVTAKLALSLDGKIASARKKPTWLSGPKLDRFTHEQRLRSDAILTTAATVLNDDPQLNARAQEIVAKPIAVIDSELALAQHPQMRIWKSAAKLTIYFCESLLLQEGFERKLETVRRYGGHPVAISAQAGKLSLSQILAHIGEEGAHDLWVEAGGTLFAALATERLIDRAYLYLTPHWLGSEALPALGESPTELLRAAKTIVWTDHSPDALAEVRW